MSKTYTVRHDGSRLRVFSVCNLPGDGLCVTEWHGEAPCFSWSRMRECVLVAVTSGGNDRTFYGLTHEAACARLANWRDRCQKAGLTLEGEYVG